MDNCRKSISISGLSRSPENGSGPTNEVVLEEEGIFLPGRLSKGEGGGGGSPPGSGGEEGLR
jgi:hypothetical protein